MYMEKQRGLTAKMMTSKRGVLSPARVIDLWSGFRFIHRAHWWVQPLLLMFFFLFFFCTVLNSPDHTCPCEYVSFSLSKTGMGGTSTLNGCEQKKTKYSAALKDGTTYSLSLSFFLFFSSFFLSPSPLLFLRRKALTASVFFSSTSHINWSDVLLLYLLVVCS